MRAICKVASIHYRYLHFERVWRRPAAFLLLPVRANFRLRPAIKMFARAKKKNCAVRPPTRQRRPQPLLGAQRSRQSPPIYKFAYDMIMKKKMCQ